MSNSLRLQANVRQDQFVPPRNVGNWWQATSKASPKSAGKAWLGLAWKFESGACRTQSALKQNPPFAWAWKNGQNLSSRFPLKPTGAINKTFLTSPNGRNPPPKKKESVDKAVYALTPPQVGTLQTGKFPQLDSAFPTLRGHSRRCAAVSFTASIPPSAL